MTGSRGPSLLSRLAAVFIRGPEAAFILVDLDDAFEYDRSRGMPLWRARLRYAVNVAGSAVSVWRAMFRPSTLGLSWIDAKLGLRMLVKYPGLTGVAVFALAVGIPVGLAPAHFASAIESHLPVEDGDRILVLRYWNAATYRVEPATSYDLARWRNVLTSFATLGAWRSDTYRLDSDDESAPPIRGAEVTASTFNILRVAPRLGRTLVAADEAAGAPAVVILGHDVWQSRFGAQPDIIGRTVRLGTVPHTVVGVMPREFRFPVKHSLWVPLRTRTASEPGQGVPLTILGRLSDHATPESAQTELSTVTRSRAVEFQDAHEQRQAEVVPTAMMTFGFPKGGLRALPEFSLIQVVTFLPLIIACMNVGLLVFARTAARSSEFSVRTALGASRTRIITQVFTESLVLAVVAAGAGLLFVGWLPYPALSLVPIEWPYWIDLGLTRATVAWALALAVFSAVAAGVVPALAVTGRSVHRTIQREGGGRSSMRIGRLSGALIVADVAIAVAAVGIAAALFDTVKDARDGQDSVGIQAEEFLSVELSLPGMGPSAIGDSADRAEFVTRLATTQQELVTRLEAEPGVRGVAVASVLPRMDHPIRIAEIEGEDVSATGINRIRTAQVDLNFFEALDQPILSGRGFDSGDLAAAGRASVVVVNTTFVDTILGGRSPLGHRVRYRMLNGEPGPWHEIVGVVGQIGMHVLSPDQDAGLYHPVAPGEVHPVHLAVHVGDDPESFAPRLRTILEDVDPRAAIAMPIALNKVFEGDWYLMAAMALGGVLLIGVLLTLAASGIYALMSFSVEERTREIGIRVALGASRRAIALAVVRRSLTQVAVGVLVGLPLAARVFFERFDDAGSTYSAVFGTAVAFAVGVGVMVMVGLIACTAPTLRALRIAPTEALKGE